MTESPWQRLNYQIEALLWHKGFQRGMARDTIKLSILLSSALLFVGICLLPVFSYVFWAAAGAVLATWNFYSMALFVLHHLPKPEDEKRDPQENRAFLAGQLLRSNFRLFITGILLYCAVVVCEADVFSLAAGLSLVVLVIPALFMIRK